MGTNNGNGFKPGQSGNPAGAPEYWSQMRTILQRLGNLSEEEFTNYKCKNMKERMVYKMLMEEDYKEVFDRIDGKAKQSIDSTNTVTVTQPIKIEFED